MPNEELASQNMISEPEEIEDSNASDFIKIKKKNEVKRGYNRKANYEGGSDSNNQAASCPQQSNSKMGSDSTLSLDQRFKGSGKKKSEPRIRARNGLELYHA